MKLNFTGRASLIVEIKNSSPMIVDIDDIDMLTAIMRVLLDESPESFPVSAYKNKTKRRAKKLLARK
jgi:hypothetical protein